MDEKETEQEIEGGASLPPNVAPVQTYDPHVYGFAAQALAGLLAAGVDDADATERAWKIAEAMLGPRTK